MRGEKLFDKNYGNSLDDMLFFPIFLFIIVLIYLVSDEDL